MDFDGGRAMVRGRYRTGNWWYPCVVGIVPRKLDTRLILDGKRRVLTFKFVQVLTWHIDN
jgi:hypothetical protein